MEEKQEIPRQEIPKKVFMEHLIKNQQDIVFLYQQKILIEKREDLETVQLLNTAIQHLNQLVGIQYAKNART